MHAPVLVPVRLLPSPPHGFTSFTLAPLHVSSFLVCHLHTGFGCWTTVAISTYVHIFACCLFGSFYRTSPTFSSVARSSLGFVYHTPFGTAFLPTTCRTTRFSRVRSFTVLPAVLPVSDSSPVYHAGSFDFHDHYIYCIPPPLPHFHLLHRAFAACQHATLHTVPVLRTSPYTFFSPAGRTHVRYTTFSATCRSTAIPLRFPTYCTTFPFCTHADFVSTGHGLPLHCHRTFTRFATGRRTAHHFWLYLWFLPLLILLPHGSQFAAYVVGSALPHTSSGLPAVYLHLRSARHTATFTVLHYRVYATSVSLRFYAHRTMLHGCAARHHAVAHTKFWTLWFPHTVRALPRGFTFSMRRSHFHLSVYHRICGCHRALATRRIRFYCLAFLFVPFLRFIHGSHTPGPVRLWFVMPPLPLLPRMHAPPQFTWTQRGSGIFFTAIPHLARLRGLRHFNYAPAGLHHHHWYLRHWLPGPTFATTHLLFRLLPHHFPSWTPRTPTILGSVCHFASSYAGLGSGFFTLSHGLAGLPDIFFAVATKFSLFCALSSRSCTAAGSGYAFLSPTPFYLTVFWFCTPPP